MADLTSDSVLTNHSMLRLLVKYAIASHLRDNVLTDLLILLLHLYVVLAVANPAFYTCRLQE